MVGLTRLRYVCRLTFDLVQRVGVNSFDLKVSEEDPLVAKNEDKKRQ